MNESASLFTQPKKKNNVSQTPSTSAIASSTSAIAPSTDATLPMNRI